MISKHATYKPKHWAQLPEPIHFWKVLSFASLKRPTHSPELGCWKKYAISNTYLWRWKTITQFPDRHFKLFPPTTIETESPISNVKWRNVSNDWRSKIFVYILLCWQPNSVPVKYSNLSVVYFRAEICDIRSCYTCFIYLLYASTSWICSWIDTPIN